MSFETKKGYCMKANDKFYSRWTEPTIPLYSIDVAKIRSGNDGGVRLMLRHSDRSGKTMKYRDFRIEMSPTAAAHLAATIVKNLV